MMKSRSIDRYRKQRIQSVIVFAFCSLTFFSLAYAAEIQYDSGSRRDPFVALVSPEGNLKVPGESTAGGEYKIEGIIFDPTEGSYALINGTFYKEGDQIENAHVISIFKDRVIMSVNDTEKQFWLREEVMDTQ